jgi:hypothetical protein
MVASRRAVAAESNSNRCICSLNRVVATSVEVNTHSSVISTGEAYRVL